jgi:hypothetical protein
MNLELARVRLFAGATLLVAPIASCGLSIGTNPGGTGGAGSGGSVNTGCAGLGEIVSGGSSSGIQRTPQVHRATGSTCPQQRGAGSVSVEYCYSPAYLNGAMVSCVQDSDCTGATNGRCLQGPKPCITSCSYDTCFSDSDCPSNQPCECRPRTSDTAQNFCVAGGNCRVDADCGPGGFCSPSLVANPCVCPPEGSCGTYHYAVNCGHGYFCHTLQDSCVDDSDCGGSTCAFDQAAMRWTCNLLMCPQ